MSKNLLLSLTAILAVIFVGVSLASSAGVIGQDQPPPPPPPSKDDRERIGEPLPPPPKLEYRDATGPSTAGATLPVNKGGRDMIALKLPDDVYISGRILSLTCNPKLFCPQAPFYALARGDNRLGLSAPTGETYVFEANERLPEDKVAFPEITAHLGPPKEVTREKHGVPENMTLQEMEQK